MGPRERKNARARPAAWYALCLAPWLLLSCPSSNSDPNERPWVVTQIEGRIELPIEVVHVPESGLRLITPRPFRFSDSVVLEDVDGDGGHDFLAAVTELGYCSYEEVYGFVRRFSGASGGADLHLGAHGAPRFVLQHSHHENSPFLLISGQIRESPLLQFHEDFQMDASWQFGADLNPAAAVYDADFLTDVDHDGVVDVVVASAWNPATSEDDRQWVGRLVLLSGKEGSQIWASKESPGEQTLYTAVLNAGDFDRDGIPDPVTLARRRHQDRYAERLEVFSGKEGELFYELDLPDLWNGSIASAGDLDRDGYDEILLDEGRSGIVSLRQRRIVNPARVWTTAWATPAGDLDGDGWEELIVARVHPTTRERRISVVTAHGIRDELWPSLDERAWRADSARIGDFDGDSLWDLLLIIPVLNERGGRDDYNEIWITSGR